jgi:hypothetical protein
MKGAVTLGIYIAICITGAAFGQTKVTTTGERTSTAERGPWLNYAPQASDRLEHEPAPPATTILPMVAPPLRPVERVVMKWGAGGRIVDHRMTFEGYFRAGTKVELRGPCYSACTLLLGYMEKANLCIAPGAFMAFHAARGEKYPIFMVGETRAMYETYPPEIRRWIDHNGGWQNLPIDGFWTMYDHSLWALGYPRCAP